MLAKIKPIRNSRKCKLFPMFSCKTQCEAERQRMVYVEIVWINGKFLALCKFKWQIQYFFIKYNSSLVISSDNWIRLNETSTKDEDGSASHSRVEKEKIFSLSLMSNQLIYHCKFFFWAKILDSYFSNWHCKMGFEFETESLNTRFLCYITKWSRPLRCIQMS